MEDNVSIDTRKSVNSIAGIKGANLALDGLELLGDETLLPQKHTLLLNNCPS